MASTQVFEFLGRVLGKVMHGVAVTTTWHPLQHNTLITLLVLVPQALFEGVVVQPQFATFFLAKLLNKTPGLHYLSSLDPVRVVS